MDAGTRTLTFGDDHSPGADAAWAWITAHAWAGWAVEVVTVTIPRSRTVTSPMGYTTLHTWEPPAPRVAPDSCGFATITHLAADNDPRLILGGRVPPGLVVVGPRGQGLLKALHLGSTAEWLMRCPNSPLVVARRPETTRSILVCVDGSRHARSAVELLASLPWLAGTAVTVLGAEEGLDDLPAAVAEASERLAAAGAAATPIVVPVDPFTLTINPRLAIFQHLDSQTPDLVVLGTSGRTGLERMWVGSVASAVARHARCSVMLVRDPHGGDDATDR